MSEDHGPQKQPWTMEQITAQVKQQMLLQEPMVERTTVKSIEQRVTALEQAVLALGVSMEQLSKEVKDIEQRLVGLS